MGIGELFEFEKTGRIDKEPDIKPKETSFTLCLFKGPAVAEKLTVMNAVEAMFDDERNDIPEEYWDIVENMKQGQKMTISIKVT